MQPSDMDKKREAFLEHLKQKYPHHASAIMGHQERLREQVSGSPKHGPSPQPSIGDHIDHLSLASLESLDAMSEADAPTAFTRGSRVRASLPVVRSTNQTKDRSLGVLYLQYGDETKQIRMPNEITSIDTVRALFVSAFPQQLTMKMLESPSVAVYVKDDMRNMYYELTDVRNITDHSCLKVYHKDPAQAFSHGPRPANGDARMHSDGQHPLRQPPMGPPTHHPLQGTLPPSPHSMPPSPSRIPFGPRQGSIPGSATIPRDRLSNANPPARSISPCPSAILERRDVKPDEDMGGKSHSLSGSPVLAPKSSAALSDKGSVPLKVNLLQFRKNVSDLRMQLHQMRQLQLQNQEALRVQLKRAEQEISVKLAEAMRRLEDPVQRQRTLVEEDRHKYLGLEERVLTQLGELEQYVGSLQKDSAATHRVVTLKDVEEGAVTLRKVGESLAGLKGEFPALQTRMRAVLRVEVEAVKFLKEEPHKLDSMLKRVKSLTDTLSSLRSLSAAAVETPAEDPPISVQPTSTAAPPELQNSTIKSGVMPSSPVVIHHVQSSPVHMQQSQQSAALTAQPSPPLTPSPTQVPCPNASKSQGRESPKGASSDPPSPARHKKAHGNPVNNGNQDLVIEELQTSHDKSKNRAMSIEAAEKEWEERRQNMGHYDGKEFEKILQEAQANMMKGIPSLEVEENPALPPAASGEQADIHNPVEPQSEPDSDKPAKKGPEKLPKPLTEKPAKPALERHSKTATKPAPTDGFTKHGSEKSSKSPPPPPPPRKTYPTSSSGMTTTRSGEVVYTSRKESVSEGEEEVPPPTPQPKPTQPKVPPETKPKPATPPPVTASVTREEEDEGDKIMAELQVFQKCTVKDVGVKNLVEPTTRIEPQIRELRPGAMLPLKEKKVKYTSPCSYPANCLPLPTV
uniref:Actin interacting protein 3-like C-terminal domain-containing protein n=1 Tax=Seriola lalandi dorsalis TaxID=1841481 RepID=A0A3B4YD76_SERLL